MKINGVGIKRIYIIFLLLLAIGVIQWRLGFANNKLMVGETDSFSRLLVVQEYIKNGGNILSPFVVLPLGGVWLPGYFSLFILLSKVGFGEVGFRIFTWICGLLLTLMVWLIAKKMARDRGIWQILVLLAFVMSPLMLQINLEMLAEPIAAFLLLVSLYFLLGEKKVWAVFFLFLSQSIRYESWFVAPFYWIYIGFFVKNVGWRKKIMLFLGTLLFPLIWVIVNFVQTGNPLSFYVIRQSYLDPSFVSQYSNILVALNGWTLRLQQYIGNEWFILWVVGLVWVMVWGQKKQKWWGWLSLYSFLIVVLQLWLKSTEWFAPRFIYFVYVLSAPVILMVFDAFERKYQKINFIRKITILIFFGWMANQYIQGIPATKNKINEYFSSNREVKNLTSNLKGDKVVYLWLESSPWLVDDFTYYLVNRNGWKSLVTVKNMNDLNINIGKGDLLIADKSLVKDTQGFSRLFFSDFYEVWLKN